MSVLITGVAGFIGSHLAERLVDSGASVVGTDGFTTYYDPTLKRGNLEGLERSERFRLVEGNLRDLELSELLAGVDVVYHLAGQPGVRRSWGREFEVYLNENLLATQLVLEAVRGTDVRRFVFASSSSVYGDAERLPTRESDTPRPVSPYGVTKLAGEHLCHLYFSRFDVPTVALRYFTVFGPRQRPDMAFTRFIQAAMEDREIEVFGDGLQSRDFTYVDDAVSATIAAAEKGRPGEAYNIAGGAQATVLEVIELLGELLGLGVPVRHLPPVPGDARHTGADVEKARGDLGYAPRTGLKEGMSKQIAALKSLRAEAES
ncbi:MAG: NAD-dependent epimerase/dehydratase family protein [Actinomycetota bacterium]